jgi:exodeoxyribonuclease-3
MAEKKIRLLSWNVNGLRAVVKKGFLEWLAAASPDILALQETRVRPEQLDEHLHRLDDYHTYWLAAEKKGYSGLGLLSKDEPREVSYGLGVPEFDSEGRVMTAEYPAFTLVNAYFPSGTRGLTRVDFKLAFNDTFLDYAERLRARGKPLIFCGDVNIAHKEIDLTYPKANEKTSGFLPVERAWLDKVVSMGYVDTFRYLYPDATERYSWWTSRAGARGKNIGWRIDYVIITPDLLPALKDAFILDDVTGSDHCPVGIELAGSLSK